MEKEFLNVLQTHRFPSFLKSGGYPGKWAGRFIWDKGEAHPFHAFLMFRKTFDVKGEIKAATLRITAADRYMLYVNGGYVGRGPARSCGPQWTSYDTHDLAKLIKPDGNIIAVLAYHYGCRNAYSREQRAGFWAQLELQFPGDTFETIGSDRSWRVRAMQGYRRNNRPCEGKDGWMGVPGEIRPVNGFIGSLTEILEADKDPVGWMNAGFNDSSWETAQEITGDSCWSYLEPRLTPQMHEREVLPVRIVKTGEARELPVAHCFEVAGTNDVPERLASEPHFPLEYAEIAEPEAMLALDHHSASFRSSAYNQRRHSAVKGARDPFIIVDFGRIYFGYPVLKLEAPAGAVIEMTYTCNLVDDRASALEVASRFGDGYVCRDGLQSWQLFEPKCFRYLQLVVRNAPAPVRIRTVCVVSSEYPANQRGRFECSDPVLTSLWKAGVDTVFLQMQDTIEMDPVRERLLYFCCGEMEQIHLAIAAAFGDLPITDLHFRQTDRMQLPDGQLLAHMRGGDSSLGFPLPSLPLAPYNPATITNYSLFYAQAVRNRFIYTGRLEFLDEHYPALARIAQWFERQSDDTGLLNNLPGWLWLDWVKNDLRRGISFAINALYVKMLDDMAEIAGWLELPRNAAKWRERAAKVREAIRRLHWDSGKGLFADCVVDGQRSEIFTELSNAMALLYGIADEKQSAAILRRLTADDIKTEFAMDNYFVGFPYIRKLFPDGLAITCASPLYTYYVLQGLAGSGGGGYALQYMSDRFESIVRKSNPPLLSEEWLMPGAEHSGNSPVHGGSAGVTWFLSTRVLGVEAASPGFAKCRIRPIVGKIKWAKGALPTVRGMIEVSWKRDDKGMTLEATIPDGLETEIILPCGNPQNAGISHNGRTVKSADVLRTEYGVGILVQGGMHTVSVIAGEMVNGEINRLKIA